VGVFARRSQFLVTGLYFNSLEPVFTDSQKRSQLSRARIALLDDTLFAKRSHLGRVSSFRFLQNEAKFAVRKNEPILDCAEPATRLSPDKGGQSDRQRYC
jgi:hypothetical protein